MRSSYLFCLLSVLSCDAFFLKGNPYYCDATTPCLDGQACDVAHHLCGPLVTGLSPAAGSPAGGTTITLQGQNFVPGMTVYLNGVAVDSTMFQSAMALQFVLPPGQCGQVVTVTAKTPEGRTVPGAPSLRYKYTKLAFTFSGTMPAPGGRAIAAGQMDANPNVDLVVAGTGPGAQLYSGGGGLAFTLGSSVIAGGNYTDVALADASGGSSAVIFARSGNGVDACKGTSDQPYTCALTAASGMQNSAFAIADLDKDGKMDVVEFRSTSLELWANFALPASMNWAASRVTNFPSQLATGLALAIAAGDFDGDGKPDLATALSSNRAIAFSKGNGTTVFQDWPTALTVPGAGNSEAPILLATMKIDQDNKDDLIIATDTALSSPKSLYMAVSQGTSFVTTLLGSYSDAPRLLRTQDVDCDGLPDVIFYVANSSSIDVYSNTGNGGFAAKQSVPLTGNILSLAVANMDGDSKPDLALLVSIPGPSVMIYQNTSTD